MLAFIKGTLVGVNKDSIVIENNGIGFNVFVPGVAFSSLPHIGQDVMVHTYFHVKEDGMNLYGFTSEEELDIFKLLISVSGIGPKGALAILSTLTVDQLRLAVMADDSKAISKAPGVGSKTAQRLIIELKDKLNFDYLPESKETVINTLKASDDKNEAVQALVALGYSQSQAFKAVSNINPDGLTVEQILKLALTELI